MAESRVDLNGWLHVTNLSRHSGHPLQY